MACGLPYAIARAVAYPDRQVVAFVGDGGFTMLMGEMATRGEIQAADQGRRHQEQHAGPDQVGADGVPRQPGICLRPAADRLRGLARACGAYGFRVDDRRTAAEILRQALSTPGPVVIEASVDPNEPPMPPKIEAKQAANFAQALAKGTPRGGRIALTVLSDKVRELV